MYQIIIALAVSTLLGWVAVGAFLRKPEADVHKGQSVPDRISLLGQHSIATEDVPEFTSSLSQSSSVQDLILRVDSASAAEVKGWLLSLAKSGKAPYEVVSLLIDRLLQFSPEETFEFIKQHKELASYEDNALFKWACIDLIPAVDAILEKDPKGNMASFLASTIDPEMVDDLYEYLVKRGYNRDAPGAFENIFAPLAKLDPKKAAELALSHTLGRIGAIDSMGLSNVIRHWYEADPEAAAQWLLSHDDAKTLEFTIPLYIRSIDQNEGISGVDRIWNTLNDDQRRKFAGKLPIAIEEVDTALEWMDANVDSSVLYGEMLSNLIARLSTDLVIRKSAGKSNPEKIAEIVSRLDPDYKNEQLSISIQNLSKEWAKKDIEAVRDWVDGLEESWLRDVAREGMLTHWMRADPMGTLDYLKQLEERGVQISQDGSHRRHPSIRSPLPMGEVIDSLFEANGNDDPQAMLAALPEAWRDQAAGAYAQRIARKAPEEAIRFLEAQSPGVERDRAIQASLAHWVMQDPSAATEWVAQMEAGELKHRAVYNVASNLAFTDVEAARAWIKEQPPSAARDGAVQNLILQGRFDEPEETLSLIQSISNEKNRTWVMQHTLETLARRDVNLAAEQVESLGLGAEWKERIEQHRALQEAFSDSSPPLSNQ